jgi:ABC-type Mn2+/Zn2+ transport system permease subunit
MAFFGDAIAHAATLGVALSILINTDICRGVGGVSANGLGRCNYE